MSTGDRLLTLEIITQFITAMLLGGLAGLQRERNKQQKASRTFAGIRTFMLISLLGFISVYAGKYISLPLLYIIAAGFLLVITVAYALESYFNKDIGATSEIAAILAFISGTLCGAGEMPLAVLVMVSVTVVLSLKERLHDFAKHVSVDEIYSTLKFAIIAFVVLPVLPDQTFGPYNVFNPHTMWLMVVLISGISFAAYFLMKVLGPQQGLGLTGFLGGLISSTAVTTSMSGQSKRTDIVNPFALAIVIACSTMFIRVLVQISVLNSSLLGRIALPLSLMSLTGFAACAILWIRKGEAKESKPLQLDSPFTIGPAIKFALLFALILFVSKAGQAILGDSGVYIVSFLAGLADVDAISVSAANLAKTGDLTALVAANAIIIAVVTNTAVKAGIAIILASREVGKRVLIILAAMLAVGIVSIVLG